MKSIQKATKRNTAKGRQAGKILAVATGPELEQAEVVFGRSAPTWADIEFIHPILSRADDIGPNIERSSKTGTLARDF